jgi:monoamine oxidase
MSFVPPQKFEISDAEEPSYRIVGGTATLIEKLVASWHSKYQNTN